MTEKQIQKFRKTVYDYYAKNKRTLPWRKTKNPYFIMVSEVMLQQTQVDRVAPKFENFTTIFPTVESLAKAPFQKVLQHWQGLGYNRRALMLHKAAKEIVTHHAGVLPKNKEELETLSGIGPYTAGAICAFAYHQPVVMIETNIRTVFIHHFFKDKETIFDKEIMPLIEKTLDVKNPRKWYSALMDYGTHLKKTEKNPSRKSLHHTKQKPFKGSDREIRGAIIRTLTQKTLTKQQLFKNLKKYSSDNNRVSTILEKLLEEKMISKKGTFFSISQ